MLAGDRRYRSRDVDDQPDARPDPWMDGRAYPGSYRPKRLSNDRPVRRYRRLLARKSVTVDLERAKCAGA